MLWSLWCSLCLLNLVSPASGHPHSFYCHLELGSDREVPASFVHYVDVEFDMPSSSASKAAIRSISVANKTIVRKWVVYKAHYNYQVNSQIIITIWHINISFIFPWTVSTLCRSTDMFWKFQLSPSHMQLYSLCFVFLYEFWAPFQLSDQTTKKIQRNECDSSLNKTQLFLSLLRMWLIFIAQSLVSCLI